MNTTETPAAWRPEYLSDVASGAESRASGVSWGAVIAGAFVAAALGLILAVLGVGLGLSAISPWPGAGVSVATIGVSAIIWLVAVHAISSGLGGYIAGRLRTKWASVHSDEVYFRDTAHGFLVWAVGIVFSIAVLAGATSSLLGASARVAGSVGGVALGTGAVGETALSATAPALQATASTQRARTDATTATTGDTASTSGAPLGYLTDTLLRSEPASATNGSPGATSPPTAAPGAAMASSSASTASASTSARPELARIFAEAMRRGSLPDADRTYAARLVAAQTGASQADAERRVDAVYAQAKGIAAETDATARSAADDARRTTARASLWGFVAALIGAFCASLAATVGGRQRDGVQRPRFGDGDHVLSRDAREPVPARWPR
jgi:hypothetical protein